MRNFASAFNIQASFYRSGIVSAALNTGRTVHIALAVPHAIPFFISLFEDVVRSSKPIIAQSVYVFWRLVLPRASPYVEGWILPPMELAPISKCPRGYPPIGNRLPLFQQKVYCMVPSQRGLRWPTEINFYKELYT